jgi:hypothetical protein
MDSHRYGATPDERDTFAYVLGLTPDMLPVVSNPRAIISPGSDLKEPGKTPSQYNTAGHVAGLANWTKRVSTDRDVERWAKQPDYGICVQTRRVRAIDVDVSDPILAAEIRHEIVAFLGFEPPCRTRPNSSKFLFSITLPGEYTKRIIRTKQTTGEFDKAGNPHRHIIEFLAEGQQFIAAGTHPSGARYEWLPALPLGIPEVTPEQFEGLWFLLAELFGAESAELRKSTGALVARKAADAKDPLVDWLFDKWEVLAEDRRTGRLDITCPFEEEHSGESSKSATSYFPAGIGGYERGHFKCQHAHCANRTDAEFIAAIGDPVLDSFDIIEGEAVRVPADASDIADLLGSAPSTPPAALPPEPNDGVSLPAVFFQNAKGGINASPEMVAVGLVSKKFSGFRLGLDSFRDEIMIAPRDTDEWRPFVDEDYVALRIIFEQKGFAPIAVETMRDAVRFVARRHKFDSAILWAEKLPAWDGVPRIAIFCPEYLGSANTEYTRAVGEYLWTALAGRVLSPGCQADMMPVLVGPQGVMKTSAVREIAPSVDFFTEIDFSDRDDNLSRRMRGRLVAEIGELKGLHSRDTEAIKAFITRRYEDWVPKYREFSTNFPRRIIFVGTTNQPEFLSDETGNRRFLPIRVAQCDPDKIERDRDQLWAEGIARFREGGIAWRDAARLAGAQHDAFRVRDSWETSVGEWLSTPDMGANFGDMTGDQDAKGGTPGDRPFLTLRDVARGALNIPDRDITRGVEMRLGKVLSALGYAKKRVMVNGEQVRRWTRD